LKAAGFRVGVASSIHFQIGDTVWPNDTKQTTQGRFRLQHLLRQMVRARCDFVLLEVTSHALVQSRLWGVNVDTAVLTNIQRDHIEYHGSFENYLHAKGLLFSGLSRAERKHGIQKTAVLPSDEPHLAYFDAFPVDRKISYGSKGIVNARDTVLFADGSRFTLKVPNTEISVGLKLPGDFNIQNALAASAAALSFGVKLSAIQKGLEAETEIPGRLETIRSGQPFTVIVDYAHTPESLEKVLSLLKPLTRGRLFLVFGATGGGRDKSKRPDMGRVAERYADYIVVTDDDPYTEPRMQIIEQIAEGVVSERTVRARRRESNLAQPIASEAELIQIEGENFWMIRDRREAVRLALS
jgi:UDP-N-acetylmuramoyl-L-alanyl-D-glutamate--2,6-diaminopimelate ligase